MPFRIFRFYVRFCCVYAAIRDGTPKTHGVSILKPIFCIWLERGINYKTVFAFGYFGGDPEDESGGPLQRVRPPLVNMDGAGHLFLTRHNSPNSFEL